MKPGGMMSSLQMLSYMRSCAAQGRKGSPHSSRGTQESRRSYHPASALPKLGLQQISALVLQDEVDETKERATLHRRARQHHPKRTRAPSHLLRPEDCIVSVWVMYRAPSSYRSWHTALAYHDFEPISQVFNTRQCSLLQDRQCCLHAGSWIVATSQVVPAIRCDGLNRLVVREVWMGYPEFLKTGGQSCWPDTLFAHVLGTIPDQIFCILQSTHFRGAKTKIP